MLHVYIYIYIYIYDISSLRVNQLLYCVSLKTYNKFANNSPEGKRPLGRPRRRWEDNIKMDLQEVGVGRGNWMELAQDRDSWRALVGTVRDFRVP